MSELKEAFQQIYTGEAKAVLRLRVYARIAEKEGLAQIAKLFRVIAFSEEIHGERALRRLKEIKDTESNVKASFESETKVAGIAYERFIKIASQQNDESALKIFSQSRDVEDVHAKLYKEAMTHLMEERETSYYVCQVCGYVSDGVLPEQCPVCGAGKEQFSKFE